MSIIEPSISTFIPKQFPGVYQAEDPQFIEFMKQYYLWLEQNGKPLYYSRNFLELMDVDTTTSDILVFIKEKYLKNIQFSTEANIRSIIKHSLDIYRSKGTQRCIDLLFRLVFNEVVGFYYPKDDLFKLSDGTWRVPKYLELSLSEDNVKLVHKTIIGNESQATAFIDDVIRRTVQGRLIDVAYISAINGSFQTYELITPSDGSVPVALCPKIIGSLSAIDIDSGSSGQQYTKGDIVKIHSLYGDEGTALVTNTTNQAGLIVLNLNDGGYGYSSNAQILVSNTIITLTNVNVTNTYARSFVNVYDHFTQGGNSGVAIATANVALNLNNITGSFIPGETIVQHNPLWQYDTAPIGQGVINATSRSTSLVIEDTKGVFYSNAQIIGKSSGATANVTSISMQVGLINIVNWFNVGSSISSPSINATVTHVNLMLNTQFAISPTLLYPEVISVNTNKLSNWTANLNALHYNYGNTLPTANSSTPFNQFLEFANVTIGKIKSIYPTLLSVQLDYPPLAIAEEPFVQDMNVRDKSLTLVGASANFQIGEEVIQTATGARGIIKKNSNTSVLYVQNLRYYSNNGFAVTSNSTTIIEGFTTGTTANVIAIADMDYVQPTGRNADLAPQSSSGLGAVTGLQILDAGFGYVDGEEIWFSAKDEFDADTGYGITRLGKSGKGQGFYEQKGGFLSDQKKLFDGFYYQNYSYEITSSKTPDKYLDMMTKIGHVAGTKMFSRYVYVQTLDSSSQITSTTEVHIS